MTSASPSHILCPYGWSDRVAALYNSIAAVDLEPGRVTRVDRSLAAVFDGAERLCPLAGLDRPAVGDWVALDDHAIRHILPRWSVLARTDPDPSGRIQVLAANIDVVLITAPADRPSPERVERELSIAWESGATPVVVVTKADLNPGLAAALAGRLLGVDVIGASTVSGEGVDAVRSLLAPARTAVLLGPSGAGKSSLANALMGSPVQVVGDVREGVGRARWPRRGPCPVAPAWAVPGGPGAGIVRRNPVAPSGVGEMMRSTRLAPAGALMVAAVLAAACSSSSKPSAAPTTTTTPAPTTTPSATTGSGTTATPTATTVPTTTASTTTATTAPVSPSSFPTPVSEALTYLQSHTSEPLAGPTALDSSVTLSATVTLGSNDYSVGLFACPSPQEVNSPSIATNCEFAADTKGSFGDESYPSEAQASAALPGIASISGPDQPTTPCPAGSPITKIVNQQVATCGHSGYPQGGPATASWTEGEWTIVFALGPDGEALQQDTEPLINRLNQEFLPPHPGYFAVEEGGDGEHSAAAWAVGDQVFSDFDYHSAVGAADMASSTRYVTP